MSSRDDAAALFGGVPSPDTVRSMVARGRPAKIPLASSVGIQQACAAATALERGLAPEAFRVIASPTTPVSLTVLQLIGEVDARRWRGELEALVAEFRAAASRLIGQFRERVEPAYERGESYPVELDVDGQSWTLHIHGEHCRFGSLSDDTVIEAHIDHPDEVDAWFLLLFAQTSGRYPGVSSACLEGIHDMDRMLTLAGLA